MADIFISYAHEDRPFVRQIVAALETEGFTVWWDHTIPPGKTWNTFLANELDAARACIVVWSRNSVISKWVLEEASVAEHADKLLPVLIDNSRPPMGFLRLQAAQLAQWNGDPRD